MIFFEVDLRCIFVTFMNLLTVHSMPVAKYVEYGSEQTLTYFYSRSISLIVDYLQPALNLIY